VRPSLPRDSRGFFLVEAAVDLELGGIRPVPSGERRSDDPAVHRFNLLCGVSKPEPLDLGSPVFYYGVGGAAVLSGVGAEQREFEGGL
jgi:hypothetical protein